MSGIKILGLGALMATGFGLSSCSDEMNKNCENAKEYVYKSRINADGFIKQDDINSFKKLNDSINNINYKELRNFAWVKEANKIKLKHAIDSTRTATRKQIFDSLDLAKKAVKHLK